MNWPSYTENYIKVAKDYCWLLEIILNKYNVILEKIIGLQNITKIKKSYQILIISPPPHQTQLATP